MVACCHVKTLEQAPTLHGTCPMSRKRRPPEAPLTGCASGANEAAIGLNEGKCGGGKNVQVYSDTMVNTASDSSLNVEAK